MPGAQSEIDPEKVRKYLADVTRKSWRSYQNGEALGPSWLSVLKNGRRRTEALQIPHAVRVVRG
jgi:hypothetical protein